MTNVTHEWITVVETSSPDVAEARFNEWKMNNKEWSDSLSPDDILIDIIRGLKGELRRYRAKRRKPPQ